MVKSILLDLTPSVRSNLNLYTSASEMPLEDQQPGAPELNKPQSADARSIHQEFRSSMHVLRGANPVEILAKDLRMLINTRMKKEELDEEEKDLLLVALNKINSKENPLLFTKDELVEISDALTDLDDFSKHFNKVQSRLKDIIDTLEEEPSFGQRQGA